MSDAKVAWASIEGGTETRCRPTVALESTVIAHGLPWPANLETARAAEEAVRAAGAEPATIAIIDGVIRIGLTDQQFIGMARDAATQGQGATGGPTAGDPALMPPRAGRGPRRIAATWPRSSPREAARRRRFPPRSCSRDDTGSSRGSWPPAAWEASTGTRRPASMSPPTWTSWPGRRGPGRLLGDEIDPRPAGDARVARDAGRPGRRLSHGRAAGFLVAIGRVTAGAPRRVARRGRRAGPASIARLGLPGAIVLTQPVPDRRRWIPSSLQDALDRPSPTPDPGHRRQAADAVLAGCDPTCHRRTQPPRPTAPPGRQRAAGRRSGRRADQPEAERRRDRLTA